MIWVTLLISAVCSGVLGRMGGAHGYDTKWRDIGCSAIVVLASILLFGWHEEVGWVYPLMFALHWASFSTYWQFFFKGKDNLGFSGFVVGLCALPLAFAHHELVVWIIVRAIALGIIWGALNRYLPQRVLCWGRDVVEEFCRYFASL